MITIISLKRFQNRTRQLLYKPGKSKILTSDTIKNLRSIDKKIEDSLDEVFESMGFKKVSDKKDEENKKDDGDKKDEENKKDSDDNKDEENEKEAGSENNP